MKQLFIPMAIAAGCLLPLQGALLARLGPQLNHPIQATMVSYVGGLLACMVILALIRVSYPTTQQLMAIDGHFYIAGVLGMVFVTGMLYLMPHIGVTTMLVAAIIGQLIASLMIDHFGGFGGLKIAISPSRIIGVILMLVGLYFFQREI